MMKIMSNQKTNKEIRQEYKEHKNFYDEMLLEGARIKKESCIKTDHKGKKVFDYLKMAEMYHNGEW